MGGERLRAGAIVLFAAAAVFVGIGNSSGRHWLVAVGFGLFALGAALFFRWRAATGAKVLDREEKTSREDP